MTCHRAHGCSRTVRFRTRVLAYRFTNKLEDTAFFACVHIASHGVVPAAAVDVAPRPRANCPSLMARRAYVVGCLRYFESRQSVDVNFPPLVTIHLTSTFFSLSLSLSLSLS